MKERKGILVRLDQDDYRDLEERRKELGTTFQVIMERLLVNWVRGGDGLPPIPQPKRKGRTV